MAPIQSIVFLDLETTGLPCEEHNKTKITEISLLAVKRSHILETRPVLLFTTGALWGCTNPFIRQGTKGLRDVTARTRLGQAWAEIAFLLGNWRYVVPWLVNQLGSLVYILAVQRAPLSLCVPIANSVAFVLTAATGACAGIEPRLGVDALVGIFLIGVGTALCCWDKT